MTEPERITARMERRDRLIGMISTVTAVLVVAVLVAVLLLRVDQSNVSEENQQILDRVEEGVDAIEQGYACLIFLLFTPPDERSGLDPEAFEATCGVAPP